MSRDPHIRPVWIPTRTLEGFTVGRVVFLDDRISIDEYDPKYADVKWECDNCGSMTPVTAEFSYPQKSVTLCELCLQRALDGIAYSKANPVSFDDAADGIA